jgi:hypothetical protein
MVARTHKDVYAQKIPDHWVQPLSRYELMKTLLLKTRILEWFWENLCKTRTAQWFSKRLVPKFLALLPLQHILI